MKYDLMGIFSNNLEAIEAAEALIDTLQPYTAKELYRAGNHIHCPNCGELALYTEFQSDQDRMGNGIYSWMYECGCGWHSISFELG